jgi:hypothetical protein
MNGLQLCWESGVGSRESGVPSVSIPTGLRIKAQGCSAQRGYPGNQVFHTIYPNRGCEIIASRDGAADRGGRVCPRWHVILSR